MAQIWTARFPLARPRAPGTDLSQAERAIHIAKRKEIYERLHPQTKHGGTPGAGRGLGKSSKDAKFASFQDDTTAKTGRSERSIAQDTTRHKHIPQIAEVIGTSLDKGEELDALALAPGDAARPIQIWMRHSCPRPRARGRSPVRSNPSF